MKRPQLPPRDVSRSTLRPKGWIIAGVGLSAPDDRTLAPRALHELTSRGVHVRSLREGVDTSTPTGRAVTSIMATIAELELELGKERRAASREARVARGLAATKPMKLDAAQQNRLLRLYQHGEPVSELTAMFGVSRSTLFRTLKVLRQQEPVSA